MRETEAHLCVKCETPFQGLVTDLCPSCRDGELAFVNLGIGLYGADSPKMGEGRRYICMKGPIAWHVHIGISPVHRNGRPCPFDSLHEAKEWCRRFERALENNTSEEDENAE